MEKQAPKERKNKNIGLITAIVFHALVMLLCFFWLAWTPPDPPLPVYGIELNLGNVDAGSGNLQQTAPQPNEVDDPSEEESAEESTEESLDEPSEEIVEEAASEQPAETYQTDQPSLNETKEEAKPKPIEKKEVKDESKAPPTSSTKNKENSKPKEQNTNGDQTNKTGDQGDPKGKIDERALYGNPGTGSGSSLDMSGWIWDLRPKPKDETDESGRIVFKVTIDEDGEILQVQTLEKTVSPAVVKIYENEVRRLTFSKTRDNASTAPTSTGTITFIIRSN